VATYSYILAMKYGLSQKQARLLQETSPMHDIGKIGIPDAILNKAGKLDHDEWEIMKTHTSLGYEMLKCSERPILRAAATLALSHHERFDRSGYPHGLKGQDIHIYGRITAICDVFDALGSARCYKEDWLDEEDFALIERERGKHFDPELVDLLFANMDEILAVRDQFTDA
jgi:response regulator RpfG family c-di-GMP phosphodiesterase